VSFYAPPAASLPRKGAVLYIEDNFENKLLVRRILESAGYEVLEADDGIAGIQIARARRPDLILMDLNIPGMDGYEATTKIKSIEGLRHIPIVAVTANVLKGDKERSLVAGCDGYVQKPIDPDTFVATVEEYLRGKIERVPGRDETRYLREYSEQLVARMEEKVIELEKANKELQLRGRQMEEVYVGVITSLMNALEAKHTYTAGHSERVTRYCLEIAAELNLSQADVVVLRRAARLHDIGKLVIELSSIDHPGALSDDQWRKMRAHTEIAVRILAPLKFLAREVDVIRDHHERYDGTGYPAGKSGEEIPLLAAVLAVADAFDAMTTDRAYQKGFGEAEALAQLKSQAGRQFHPRIVEALLSARRHARER
jgi:putative nucleotidyltransferase with HDIG domain